MDLAFTPEEQTFRETIRDWVTAHLPSDLSTKVHNAQRLHPEDMQRWAKILGAKGWLGYSWPTEFGGPGWSAVQKHLFEGVCFGWRTTHCSVWTRDGCPRHHDIW